MGPQIRTETALADDRYVNILSDSIYPFMSTVHSDGFGQVQQDTPYVENYYGVAPGTVF